MAVNCPAPSQSSTVPIRHGPKPLRSAAPAPFAAVLAGFRSDQSRLPPTPLRMTSRLASGERPVAAAKLRMKWPSPA